MSTNDFDTIFGVWHNLHFTTIPRLKKQAMSTSGTEVVQGVLLHAVRRVLLTNDFDMNTSSSFPDIDLKDTTDDGNSALDLNIVVVVIIMIFCVCMVCCCVIDM